jgi:hypothetical protein
MKPLRVLLAVGFLLFFALASPNRSYAAQPRGKSKSRGSAENPIPLSGAQILVPRRAPIHLHERLEFRLGPFRGSMFGTSGVLLAPGGRLTRRGDTVLSEDANVYWGDAIELPLGHSKNVLLDGGRVTLGTPIDVPEWRGADRQYWSTSAGLQVRF